MPGAVQTKVELGLSGGQTLPCNCFEDLQFGVVR